METTKGVRKEVKKSELIVRRNPYKSQYQKEGTLTAELSQMVETISFYPTKAINSNLEDNIFKTSEFKFQEQQFQNKENRIAWIDVPEEMKKEMVEAKLQTYPEATLYRILSNRPVLSDREKYAINQSLVELDTFANRQVVRYPVGNEKEGQVYLDPTGKIQYRRIAFSTTGKEDIDLRTNDENDYYLSKEIEKEINQTIIVSESQSI